MQLFKWMLSKQSNDLYGHYNYFRNVVHLFDVVLKVVYTIGSMFTEMFKGLRDQYAKEIETVSKQYPAEPFKFLDPPLRLEYPEGVAMLKEAGVEMAE